VREVQPEGRDHGQEDDGREGQDQREHYGAGPCPFPILEEAVAAVDQRLHPLGVEPHVEWSSSSTGGRILPAAAQGPHGAADLVKRFTSIGSRLSDEAPGSATQGVALPGGIALRRLSRGAAVAPRAPAGTPWSPRSREVSRSG